MSADLLQKAVNIRREEVGATLWSCGYFFCVLCSYYILRPLREEMGLAGGVRNLPWLYLCTLGAMLLLTPLFAALVARFSRRVFIPVTYGFFIANLLVFFAAFHVLPERGRIYLGRVFYVWISVFNLFVVSVFWSLMADGFSLEQGKRLFGLIAVGGTLGALVGAALTAGLVEHVGRINLILFSAGLLVVAIWCVEQTRRRFDASPLGARELGGQGTPGSPPAWEPERKPAREPARVGRALDGITQTLRSPYLLAVCAYLFLYPLTSTFVYFEQANIVDVAFGTDRAGKVQLFAQIDFWASGLTLVLQVLLTGRIISRFGVGLGLMLLPILTTAGFVTLGLAPVLGVLVVFQVLRRAGNYGITRPARETLFTVLPPLEKYQAKNFIDTFVYRSADAAGAWIFGTCTAAGIGLSGMAFVAAPLALAWGAVGAVLGVAQRRLARRQATSPARGTAAGVSAAP